MPSAVVGDAARPAAEPQRWRSMAAPVAGLVALGVALGARAFAQHVEAEAQPAFALGRRLRPWPRRWWRPSTNCRPSSWMARTVAATTVCARPGAQHAWRSPPSGSNFLTARWRWPTGWPACGGAPSPSWPPKSAPAGRPSARMRFRRRARAAALRPERISARPSALLIGYSRSSDSSAQNGAGLARTACTQGVALRGHANPVEGGRAGCPATGHDSPPRGGTETAGGLGSWSGPDAAGV